MNGTDGGSKRGDGLHDAPQVSEKVATPSKEISKPEVVTQVLQFLSTASPETLGAITVALAACTWLLLGRLGLLLIGALGGVVLHATWEGQSSSIGAAESIRREAGLDVVRRILDWRDLQTKNVDDDEEENKIVESSFEGFQPETGAALNDLVDAVIRDYVKWWYHPILPKESTFPAASKQTLTKFLLSISYHLSRKRPADTFLDFLTNSSSIVIVFLSELSSALSTQPASVPAAEAVYTYLSSNPESNLANVLNEKQHMKKFKMIAEDLLQNFLEKPTFDCDPARVFLREILAGVCLDMTLKSVSKPEWINGWIVHLLEEGEPNFSQAIDAGIEIGADLGNPFNDIDGNVGNIGLAKPSKPTGDQETKRHKKRLSKAEEAMEEAMEEAKRLSRLIEEEDKKAQSPKKSEHDASKALMTAIEQNTKKLNLSMTALTENTAREPFKTPTSQTSFEGLSGPSESPISPASKRISREVAPPQSSHSFTSFDQIVPPLPLTLREGSPQALRKAVSFTLQNANIIIHDDSTPADKGKIRSKPNADYLIQIEPSSSGYPGWMIVRRYPDFETLHEVLRRIAKLSGVKAFTEQHSSLPNWKEHTKASLRGELERYLRDACWHNHLAESEGMKRFLEKDQEQLISGSSNKNGFPGIGWPTPSAFENMGKGMLDVLTSAPKGVAEGGKAIGGGITGVLTNIGNLGQKKPNGNSTNASMHTAGRASTSTLPRMDSMSSVASLRKGRASEESLRPAVVQTQPSTLPPMERRPSYNSIAEDESEREPRLASTRSSVSGRRSTVVSRDPSVAASIKATSPLLEKLEDLKLPPPPSTISEDYGNATDSTRDNGDIRTPTSTAPSQPSPGRPSMSGTTRSSVQIPRKPRKEWSPVTEEETRVAVELLFAVITELYTLSSAWKFRKTLLNAAKTYLLRPGNPSLSSIQSLIHESVLAANTSDAGIATHLRKMRENTLPTEDELKAWPAEMTMEEKERLRIKARKLLVERGVPNALTGVMGQAATGEAMGRVFDCLQVEEVNRGLMFGMLLQFVRAITH